MKKFITMFLFNVFTLMVLIGGYFYPEYMFYVESFFWIFGVLFFLSHLTCMNSKEVFDDMLELLKEKTWFYRAVDWIFDLIVIFCFIFLELKSLFILYLIILIFEMAVRIKAKEALQEKE